MPLGEICNREVVVVAPEETVAAAARLMRDAHVGNLVVVRERDGRKLPVGIITDRDIVVDGIARGLALDKVAVETLMTRNLVTAAEDTGIIEAIKRMRERGVRRMPVVDRDDALVGIITVDDLVEMLANELSDLSRLILREQTAEWRLRR